jgi:hypothetical protein
MIESEKKYCERKTEIANKNFSLKKIEIIFL